MNLLNKCYLLALFLFISLLTQTSQAFDISSYLPFLSRVPEDNVGVFKNGNRFYDDVYPAGVYKTWPNDKLMLVSIKPEKTVETDVSCISIEGVKITFPEIIVHYQLDPKYAVDIVKKHGINFLQPAINSPVQEGVANFCASVTADTIYLDKFSILKQQLNSYLTTVQQENDSGLSITEIEIPDHRILDEMLNNHNIQNQQSIIDEPPYDVFFTLEDGKEVRNRFCKHQTDETGPSEEAPSKKDSKPSCSPQIVIEEEQVADDHQTSEANESHEDNLTGNVPCETTPPSIEEIYAPLFEPIFDNQYDPHDSLQNSEQDQDTIISKTKIKKSSNADPEQCTAKKSTAQNLPEESTPSDSYNESADKEVSEKKNHQPTTDNATYIKNKLLRLYQGW